MVQEIKNQSLLPEYELFDIDLFDKIWTERSDEFIDTNKSETTLDLNKVIKELSVIFNSILGFANYMKSTAPKLLEDVLINYPYHPPHISLLLAFLKGYNHAQKDINNILTKQLDYFYFDLLGQKENETKIVYTGLRKGEKLSEQLFFNEEKISNTSVKGIMSTTDKVYNVDTSEYDNLISYIQKNETKKAINKFKKMLPEYKVDVKD